MKDKFSYTYTFSILYIHKFLIVNTRYEKSREKEQDHFSLGGRDRRIQSQVRP